MSNNKPIIGRFSNEQLRFTRNTGYKRSDFVDSREVRFGMFEVKVSLLILAVVLIGGIGLGVAR